MLGSVCDRSVVIGPRAPESGVLRVVQHRDFHHKYRMADVSDRSTPKNFPPGNLFLEVFEGGSGVGGLFGGITRLWGRRRLCLCRFLCGRC